LLQIKEEELIGKKLSYYLLIKSKLTTGAKKSFESI